MSYYPGGIAAPDYNQKPPRMNRAGLVIVLMLVLLVAVVGTGIAVAVRLVNSRESAEPAPAPVTSVAPSKKPTQPVKPTTTPSVKKPSVTPVRPVQITPEGPRGGPEGVAKQLVARLNANDGRGVGALACPDANNLLQTLLRTQVKQPAKLTTGRTIAQEPVIAIELSGTMNGKGVSGVIVIRDDKQGLCVQAFQVIRLP
ncbi:hypothetical protein HPO96_16150 [Kribbella sandramycini]|uniref:Uncharacterized protein n=1 Tax=Kribbella sandramycini TaxID=60450 RepID=A0A7Y4NZN4_9ACTN|nr:hypothetical protein [Kribbella sandramycini]MBB6565514.1 hypothetical protein [Kribbella sandramycini]NOL41781.1 hypothetical protein [Kribbella sandramycini]